MSPAILRAAKELAALRKMELPLPSTPPPPPPKRKARGRSLPRPGGLRETMDALVRSGKPFTLDDVRRFCLVPIAHHSPRCLVARYVREGKLRVVFDGSRCRKKSVYRRARR